MIKSEKKGRAKLFKKKVISKIGLTTLSATRNHILNNPVKGDYIGYSAENLPEWPKFKPTFFLYGTLHKN
jgi:hypothetical protein